MPFDLRKEFVSSLVQPETALPVVPGHAVITPSVDGWASGLQTESSASVTTNSLQDDKLVTPKTPGQE